MHYSWAEQGISIPPVQIHDTDTEGRGRALSHYLKDNHAKYSLLYHGKLFHNHVSHILGSAYLLGASTGDFKRLYEAEIRYLEPWTDSPGDITPQNWRNYLGKKEFERAFLRFFQSEIDREGGDWKKVAAYYLFSGKQPLINSVLSGAGHPLIHLGYAYALSSSELGMEAIALAATDYSDIHKYLENETYSEVRPPYKTSSLLEILENVRTDKRLDGLSRPGYSNLDLIFRDYETPLLEHWNAWRIEYPTVVQFRESQKAAAAIVIATNKHDFFLVHLLTTSHAIRVLLPVIPPQFHISILRQWWLITLALYIAQLRPEIKSWQIPSYELKGRGWSWAISSALKGQHSVDAHYVKAIHALEEASKLWGDPDSYFLKAALKFADEFHGWDGFF